MLRRICTYMSFDEIFDLTAGVYFNFYNIYGAQTQPRKHALDHADRTALTRKNDL